MLPRHAADGKLSLPHHGHEKFAKALDNVRNVAIRELHFRDEDNIKGDNTIRLFFLLKDGITSDI